MSATSSGKTATPRSDRRRWRIPPPPLQDGNAPGPEGLAVLGEIDGDLGVILWKSLRSVLLWADTDPGNRRKLFEPEASHRRCGEISKAVPSESPELLAPLEDLLSILEHPEETEAELVGHACRRVAVWAGSQGAKLTQLEFLQAAAACRPDHAGLALEVGGAARDLTHYAKAEAWFYRAVGLARQSGRWPEYVTAYLKHGIMMQRRGALPAARRSFLKAMRRSRRQGIRDGEARALHNLFTVEYLAGSHDRAIEYAARAVVAYGPSDERLPRLAHDIAYVWLEQGDFEHSLPIFMATLARVGPPDRPTVLGSLSRAAAGMNDVGAYAWALRELRLYAAAPRIADAWVEMARAALALGRYEEAEEAAGLAETVARARREGQIRFMAEEILTQIRHEQEAHSAIPATTEQTVVKDRLARDLIRTLQVAPASETPVWSE